MIARTCLQSPIVFAPQDNRTNQPILASTRDYGFDFHEEQVGAEMLAPLPFNPVLEAIIEINTNEFEQDFQCFLS